MPAAALSPPPALPSSYDLPGWDDQLQSEGSLALSDASTAAPLAGQAQPLAEQLQDPWAAK